MIYCSEVGWISLHPTNIRRLTHRSNNRSRTDQWLCKMRIKTSHKPSRFLPILAVSALTSSHSRIMKFRLSTKYHYTGCSQEFLVQLGWQIAIRGKCINLKASEPEILIKNDIIFRIFYILASKIYFTEMQLDIYFVVICVAILSDNCILLGMTVTPHTL